MQVAILADTHVPDREQSIPEPFRERISEADHVVHAGDFTSPDTLGTVRDLAGDLTAVHGNMEADTIDLPSTATVDVDGVGLAVTHGHMLDGEPIESLSEWYETVRTTVEAADADVGIGAHSHRVEDQVRDDVRLLNPGTATGADPAEDATMLTATVDDGDLDVTVHDLE